jgi:NAD-dependent SIR2 family protein deacetylase
MIQDEYKVAVTATSSTPSPSQSHVATPIPDGDLPSSSQASASSTPTRKPAITSMKGQDLFDSSLWNSELSTAIHYTFITSLRRRIRDVIATTPTHKFIRTLRDGGRLVRCYTQNIDGLEDREGLCSDLSRGKGNKTRFMKKVLDKPRPSTPIAAGDVMDGGCEVVQLHGDLEKLRCTLCHKLYSWEGGYEEIMLIGKAPKCLTCTEKNDDRKAKGKRGTSMGVLRPNIVLYGEEHPQNQLLAPLPVHDLSLKPDVLIIMGTSLKVHGLKNLVREFAKAVHATGKQKGKVIFVNRTKPSETIWNDVIDYHVQMDTDAWVSDLRQRREDLWLRQGELQVQVTKKKAPKRKGEDAGLDEESASPTKAPKLPVDGTEMREKPKNELRTPKKVPKRKSGGASLDGESNDPQTPKPTTAPRKKKVKTATNSDATAVLSMAPSSPPDGLLTPPPNRDKDSKRKELGITLPDVETLPLRKQRLKLKPPKMPVFNDGGPSTGIAASNEVLEAHSATNALGPKSGKDGNLDLSSSGNAILEKKGEFGQEQGKGVEAS